MYSAKVGFDRSVPTATFLPVERVLRCDYLRLRRANGLSARRCNANLSPYAWKFGGHVMIVTNMALIWSQQRWNFGLCNAYLYPMLDHGFATFSWSGFPEGAGITNHGWLWLGCQIVGIAGKPSKFAHLISFYTVRPATIPSFSISAMTQTGSFDWRANSSAIPWLMTKYKSSFKSGEIISTSWKTD